MSDVISPDTRAAIERIAFFPTPEETLVPVARLAVDGLAGVLTIPETAGYLKVTRQTVHALINRGELRRFKVGRCTRIPAADVLALVGGGGDAAA